MFPIDSFLREPELVRLLFEPEEPARLLLFVLPETDVICGALLEKLFGSTPEDE